MLTISTSFDDYVSVSRHRTWDPSNVQRKENVSRRSGPRLDTCLGHETPVYDLSRSFILFCSSVSPRIFDRLSHTESEMKSTSKLVLCVDVLMVVTNLADVQEPQQELAKEIVVEVLEKKWNR